MKMTLDNSLPTIAGTIGRKKKKILFANIPADGHFNPLTSLAVHLKEAGHDVRWYTGPSYAPKIEKLGISYYLFNKAKEVTVKNIDEIFPQRKRIKNHIKKVIFDICSYFIERGPEFYEDILEINQSFDFDVLVADNGFTGISFVKEKLKKHTVTVGILPLNESSDELPPTIMGLTPATNRAEKMLHAFLRYLTNNVLLKKPFRLLCEKHNLHGIPTVGKNIFDIQIEKSTLYLQSGTPGFEYPRSSMSKHIHFIGPLLPYGTGAAKPLHFADKLQQYDKVILLTQGTFEGDMNKLAIPTLEAFKNSNKLVILTTAGWHTAQLKERYKAYDNIVIEDFIPYAQVMPHVDVFVSNGGYGGVLLGICNKLPMVVAGIHEGKNEICARIGYFKLGINLRTETPGIEKIKKAVSEVLAQNLYKKNVEKLAAEFDRYNPATIFEEYIDRLPVVRA
jgi:UDP:flavonoid glycosyltransferase YjiC (YdhE family)